MKGLNGGWGWNGAATMLEDGRGPSERRHELGHSHRRSESLARSRCESVPRCASTVSGHESDGHEFYSVI
jgi:hypothetical protein